MDNREIRMEFGGTVLGCNETRLIGLKCKVVLYENYILISAINKNGQEISVSHSFSSYEQLKFEHITIKKKNFFSSSQIHAIDINITEPQDRFIGKIKVDEYQIDTIIKLYSSLKDNENINKDINSNCISDESDNSYIDQIRNMFQEEVWKKFFDNITSNDIVTFIGDAYYYEELEHGKINMHKGLLCLRNNEGIFYGENNIFRFSFYEGLIKVNISESEYRDSFGDFVSISSDNAINLQRPEFSMMPEKINLLNEHYNKTNNLIKNKQLVFRMDVDNIYEVLSNDVNIMELVLSYIDKSPQIFLYEYTRIIILERLISFQDESLSDLTLLSTRYQRNNIDRNLFIETKNYFDEYFDLFFKVLQSKYDFVSTIHCKSVTWMLIRNAAIRYFSNIWGKEYGALFKEIDGMNYKESIGIYTNIETIKIDTVGNVSLFTYYLMDNSKFENSTNFLECNEIVVKCVLEEMENLKVKNFERNLITKKESIKYTIDDVDLMSGLEFENFVSILFNRMGYSTIITKATGDQGIDIIAERNDIKIGIQAKNYSSAVTNSAIQEVAAGIIHYKLDKGIVVTNNLFTKSAIKLAESNNIVLWDRNILKEKITILNE